MNKFTVPGENATLTAAYGKAKFQDEAYNTVGGALNDFRTKYNADPYFDEAIELLADMTEAEAVELRNDEGKDDVIILKTNGFKALVKPAEGFALKITEADGITTYTQVKAVAQVAGTNYETLKEAYEAYLAAVAAAETDDDKAAVAKALATTAASVAKFESVDAADKAGTALVFMGHGTAHTAKITYSQMQTQMEKLGYKNVFVGTVEGEPEETALDNVIAKVSEAGYKNVVLRPMMVVAGDHANNDMADPEDPESWFSGFTASKKFEKVDCQIEGLGRIAEVQELYLAHTAAAVAEASK